MTPLSLQKLFGKGYNTFVLVTILHTIVSILLIGAILLQMQGTGLTNSFGGSGEFYRSKRSIEKILVRATVVLAILFALLSMVLLFPHK